MVDPGAEEALWMRKIPPHTPDQYLRVTVSPHLRGTIAKMPPPPPPPGTHWTSDRKEDMQKRGHMIHKITGKTTSWDACSALLRDKLCVPLFLPRVFDFEELQSYTCSTGATGMGSPAAGLAAGLAANWTADLAALMVDGLAQDLGALGTSWAAGSAGGSSPCGKHCTTSTSSATAGDRTHFGGLHSPVSCPASGSSAGQVAGGYRNASNFSCNFFPESPRIRILASTTLPPDRWRLTTVPAGFASI